MLTTFIDDDDRFVRWREEHPEGFVVNHNRVPKSTYLKLHRATCTTLQGPVPARGDNWTRTYAKTCSDDLNDLRHWARSIDGRLDPCRTCGA